MQEFDPHIDGNLTEEQLGSLLPFRVDAPYGSFSFQPYSLRRGRAVDWRIDTYIDGVIGPFKATRATFKRIGAPDAWFDLALQKLAELQSLFPSLPAGFPESLPAITQEQKQEASDDPE